MGDLVLGLAKTVVQGALTKAQSAIEEEAKLRQSVQSDLVFITGEFQMMQSFLNATNEERVRNDVVRTWVRQVRDLAYDVEDCIDFVVHLDKKTSWWFRMLPSCVAPALPLDEAVAEIKQLKARVEDVSHRNVRYNLITDSSSKAAAVVQQQPTATAGAAAFDVVQEARDTARRHRGLVDLTELVANKDDLGLQVISLWGTGGDLGTTSVIKKAYDDRDVRQAFGCRGWAKLTHPFNPHEFLRSLLTQFSANSGQEQGATAGVDSMTGMETAAQYKLVKDLGKQVEEKRYLVVLEDVSTVAEWEAISMYLPDRKNGSRIVVSTQQLEVASFCTTKPWGVSELMQLSADHSVCVFYSKEGRPRSEIITKSKEATINRMVWRQKMKHAPKTVSIGKMKLALDWADTPHVVGREEESFSIYQLLFPPTIPHPIKVVSVWGIAGVGKSTLVRDVFYRVVLGAEFSRFGWVDVPHSLPLDLREFSRSLLSDLYSESLEAKEHGACNLVVSDLLHPSVEDRLRQKQESLEAGMLGFVDPVEECRKLLQQEHFMVVIDGLRSTAEWDLIKSALLTPAATTKGAPTCIMVITDKASVATHCSMQDKSVRNVKGLGAADALDLFKKKVFKGTTEIPHLTTDMEEQANLLVDKCGGLPKVIVAVAGFLATEPKVAVAKEWRKLNDSFMHELETNPRFDSLRGLFTWMQSYFRSCPDYLKPCIFYLSIFPAGKTSVRRRRLVRRWIAEGYSRDMDGRTTEEKAEMFFSELAGLSIIQQPPETATATYVHKRMVSCQVNGFFREYISSRPMEDNLVFALEGSCSVETIQCRGRHLAIRRRWDRDINVYRSIDFSRLRSLTVFGEWRPFFVSEGMKLLRVLDLEDTSGLIDDDLEQIAKLVPRLKFLSLRGCTGIHRLPDSLGGLTQLETLDARYTSVAMLPTAIFKLQKLQYLRAGAVRLDTAAASPPPSTPSRISKIRRGHPRPAGPHVGVQVLRGGIVGKMTTLHTLGVVDVSVAAAAGQGEAVLKELRNLTQLRKLGVSGINPANSKELWSAISGHGHLESLWARLEDASDDGEQGFYGGCSDGTVFLPPEKLQSLKLFGHVSRFPAWINQLQNLRKLNLHMTILAQDHIYVLGDLPNLRILRLCLRPVQDDKLHFRRRPGDGPSFKCLGVLEIACNSSLRLVVTFESYVMSYLELLKVRVCSGSSLRFVGLYHLRNIRRIFLKDYEEALVVKENLVKEIANHEYKPVLVLE